MRNMLALFAAGILTVVGLGWYLGWYKVRNQPASVPGQHSVQIDINTKQIGQDLQRGEQKIQQMIESKAKDEAKDVKKAKDELMLPSPPAPPSLKVETKHGPSLEINSGNNKPLFQFHGDNGSSVEIGGNNGTTIQFGKKK